MKTPADFRLLDTNVLVYAHLEDSAFHSACQDLIEQSQRGEVLLCVTSQVLAEFYAVITDSRRVTAYYQPAEAIAAIERILAVANMLVLPTPADIVPRWLAMLRKYAVVRGAIFDVQLAATMLANGVSRIYTFDRLHFERFDELEVLTP
jgi:uncharacterized protein